MPQVHRKSIVTITPAKPKEYGEVEGKDIPDGCVFWGVWESAAFTSPRRALYMKASFLGGYASLSSPGVALPTDATFTEFEPVDIEITVLPQEGEGR